MSLQSVGVSKLGGWLVIRRIAKADHDLLLSRAAEFVLYHFGDIRPISRQAIYYSNISSFKPAKWAA